MKKLIALIMVVAMIATFAACGNNGQTEKETTGSAENNGSVETTDAVETTPQPVQPEFEPENANEILTHVWNKIPQDQKPMVVGGYFGDQYTEGPNSYNMDYAADLAAALLIPEDQMAYVTDASTAIHLQNANTMTVGLVKVSEGADQQVFADSVYDRISTNQWMCGFPEKLIITQVYGDYIFIAFGATEILDTVETQLDASWPTNDFYNEAM